MRTLYAILKNKSRDVEKKAIFVKDVKKNSSGREITFLFKNILFKLKILGPGVVVHLKAACSGSTRRVLHGSSRSSMISSSPAVSGWKLLLGSASVLQSCDSSLSKAWSTFHSFTVFNLKQV